MIAASAIGYYGPAGDPPVEESAPRGEGFAAAQMKMILQDEDNQMQNNHQYCLEFHYLANQANH